MYRSRYLTIVCLSFISTVLFSQDYYYYKNRVIKLKAREDKIAYIFNSGLARRSAVKNQILSLAGPGAQVKEASANTLLVVFGNNSTFSKKYLSSIIPGVKFCTRTYYGDSPDVTQVPTDEFVVKLKDMKDIKLLNEMNTQNNCTIIEPVGKMGFLIKTLDDVSLNALELSEKYFQTGVFEYCQPNFLGTEYSNLLSIPNDPLFPSQWALKNSGQAFLTGGNTIGGDTTTVNGIPGADMGIEKAWAYSTGAGVKIGFFDSGVDSTHPDLSANLLTGYNSYYNTMGISVDSNGHGTCVAGLIGAVANNGIGIAGIAYNAKMMVFKTYGSDGLYSDVAIGRAFDSATVWGIDILSNSWGGVLPSSVIDDAINNAALNGRRGLGCIILFSSGNQGFNPPVYPSYLPNVISVGAATPRDEKKTVATGNCSLFSSNWGESAEGDLDCIAPSNCYATDIQGEGGRNSTPGTAGDYYATFNGTSSACPNAAGVAALILSAHPGFTRTQVTEYLLRGCDKIDNLQYSSNKIFGKWSLQAGYGRVNAYNSLRLAAGANIMPPTIIHSQAFPHSSTRVTRLTAEIVDNSGAPVPPTGINQPKLFYKYNKNSTGWSPFDSLTAVSFSGNKYSFDIPCFGYETDVQYYFRARDAQGIEALFPRNADKGFLLPYFSIGTFESATYRTASIIIMGGGGVSRPRFYTDDFKIVDVKTAIYITHPAIWGLNLWLLGPIGSDPNINKASLFEGRKDSPGDNGNITGAIVTDSATNTWNNALPPYSTGGPFLPVQNYYGYRGMRTTTGMWRFVISNHNGNSGTCDSAVITFTKATGIVSSCARLNSPADSTVSFGNVPADSIKDKNFYLKNTGTAILAIDSVRFSGTYFYKYSTLASPTVIAPGDSGLIKIRLTNRSVNFLASGSRVSSPNDATVMNIYNNDPCKQNFRVLLNLDNPLFVTPGSKPYTYLLQQNYPNPFNPVTKINYSIRNAGAVLLKIFNVLGKEIAVLVNEEKQPGEYHVVLDASNFASGVYYYKLISGTFEQTKKMLLIK